MAGRYDNWFHRQGGNDRPDLVSAAKKLLGFLEERQKASGNMIQAIERTLLDGSVIRASIHGSIPKVEIFTKDGKKETEIWNSVIVVWPAPSVSGRNAEDHPMEAIKPPQRGKGDPWGHRTITAGQGGSVDWRNADESIVLSWHGPVNRYFDVLSNPYRKKLYYNGKVILDLADDPIPAEIMNDVVSPFTIRGAAIRGTKLMVMMTSTNPRTDRLIEMPWVDGVPNAAAATMLVDRQPGFAEYESTFYHPWMFNSKGTEARCLRGFSEEEEPYGDFLREVILTVTVEDGEVVADFEFEDTPEAVVTQTTTTITHHIQKVIHCTKNVGFFNYPDAAERDALPYLGTIDMPFNELPTEEYVNVGAGDSDCVTAQTINNVPTVTGNTWFKCGVDYRNDVPVYLERRLDTNSTSTSGTVDISATLTDEFSSSSLTYTKTGFDSNTITGSASRNRSYSYSASTTNAHSMDRTTGGFRFDNHELLEKWTRTTTGSTSLTYAWSSSSSYTNSECLGSNMRGDGNGTMLIGRVESAGWENGHTTGPMDSPIFVGEQVNYSGSEDFDDRYEKLALMFADLRYGFAAFIKTIVTTVRPETFSGTRMTPKTTATFGGSKYITFPVFPSSTREVEFTHERATGTKSLPKASWTPPTLEVEGSHTVCLSTDDPYYYFEYGDNGFTDMGFSSGSNYYVTSGPPLYADGKRNLTPEQASAALKNANPSAQTTTEVQTSTTSPSVFPGFGDDVNSIFAFQLNEWSGWDSQAVFQQDEDGVRCYGSWQFLRGHLVYSQIAGSGSGGTMQYAAGTSGPSIVNLTPSYGAGPNGMLYHPMFIHTKVR